MTRFRDSPTPESQNEAISWGKWIVENTRTISPIRIPPDVFHVLSCNRRLNYRVLNVKSKREIQNIGENKLKMSAGFDFAKTVPAFLLRLYTYEEIW